MKNYNVKNKFNIKVFLIFALVTVLSMMNSFAFADESGNSNMEIQKESTQEETNILASTGKTTYTARIMQGNTNEEEDCLATHNGLTSSGSYTNQSIVETGWTFVNSTSSTMNEIRATATNFLWAGQYTFAYFTGHGSRSSSIPKLNATPSNPDNASGTWTMFDVSDTLDVYDSTWRDDSEWQEDDSIRVLMLASCYQLDSSVMKYYARAMRASSMMAVAGYHETGPGHDDDVEIAEAFFDYAYVSATEGNSVKYSWEHGNEDVRSSAPWAVLVYKENSNQYYRIPGFPGNTYTTPSSTASIYRYASHLSSSQLVSLSAKSNQQIISLSTKDNATETSELPLFIKANEDSTKALESIDSREAIDSKNNLPLDSRETDTLMKNLFIEDEYNKIVCLQTPVVCGEVDPDIGYLDYTEIIVERIYKYFNTYNNIRVNNSFVSFFVDQEGINTATSKWKTVEADTSKGYASNIINQETALINIEKAGYDTKDYLRITLVYEEVKEGLCKLQYEFVSNEGEVLYVDVETGNVER